ncbi:hypothetical protein [Streptomyces incarnatus]|uniref:hypothetical protein n=1 Tax=Streptomyces incarnatus TaxID=665007 RepID=UPI000AEFA098
MPSRRAWQAVTGQSARGCRGREFAQDAGEGGLSEYHLRPGGDLLWEIGTGYVGCRTRDGDFDAAEFTYEAAHDDVKCLSTKPSQGAKPPASVVSCPAPR